MLTEYKDDPIIPEDGYEDRHDYEDGFNEDVYGDDDYHIWDDDYDDLYVEDVE